jgi:hypothetical protein
MTLQEFQAFVGSHADRFVGVHPHPAAELDRMERILGGRLPDALRWLLTEYGYSECCGVSNLNGGSPLSASMRCARWMLRVDRIGLTFASGEGITDVRMSCSMTAEHLHIPWILCLRVLRVRRSVSLDQCTS